MTSPHLSRRTLLGAGTAAALPMTMRTDTAGGQAAPARTPAILPVPAMVAPGSSVLAFIPDRLHAAIADGTNREDLAPFINRAIATVSARAAGGVLFFPPGSYDVSEIDATNADPAAFGQLLRLVGAGRMVTRIRPAGPDGVLLNALGRNELQVESMQFLSAAYASQAAILLGRTQASPNCNGNRFHDLLIEGNYAKAAVASFAAESTTWTHCEFRNANTDARHRCLVSSNDPAALPITTRHGGPAVASSNTDNTMIDCEFYTPQQGAQPVLFVESAGYTMIACTVLAGDSSGTRLVTYRPGRDAFTGPVTWLNPHLEVFGKDNIVHFIDALPGRPSYFRGINSYSGNYVISGDTAIVGSRDAGRKLQPILMQSTWTVPIVPWDSRNLTFEVYGLSDSSIDFRLADAIGTLRITGYSANNRVRAAIEEVAQVVESGAPTPRC